MKNLCIGKICQEGSFFLCKRICISRLNVKPINIIQRYGNSTLEGNESWKPVVPITRKPLLIPKLFATLSKLKLSSLIVVTTIAGFQLSPLSNDLVLQGWTALGVGLSSFAANCFNQWLEAPFDSQMGRTKTRPLPTHQLSPFTAFHFGIVSGITGTVILASKIGVLAASLSGLNILLYAAIYTPMKRTSIANTWVGALVGAIPPIIGYIAGGGGIMDLNCLALGGLLYCWQFPHFNSLSWNLKGDYSRAGYCMTSVLNPQLNVSSALRHSIATIPFSLLFVYTGMCTEIFAFDSSILNVLLIYLANQFRRKPERKTARVLFFYSLLYLPMLLGLMIFHKQRS